jgi:hypothetical protein
LNGYLVSIHKRCNFSRKGAKTLRKNINMLIGNNKEALINSSFRPERSGEPESSALNTIGYWIPAFAGMTEE